MPFTPKDWHDAPDTPLSAAAIEDLETRLGNYADAGQPLSLRRDFALNPSMTASALGTGINNAIQSAISARRALSLGYEMWPVDVPLLINGPLRFGGDGCFERWGSRATSNAFYPANVDGAGIIQTSAAADGIQIPVTGESVHLQGFCVRFDGSHRFTNTGHGIYSQPPTYLTGRDWGLNSPRWDNVCVYGHDGNHYAFNLVNAIYGTFGHLHSFGGGGLRHYQQMVSWNFGNHVFVAPYLNVVAGGSAHCYDLENDAISSSAHGLMMFAKPQGWVANAAIGGVTAPTSAQKLVNADAFAERCVWIHPDMETNVSSPVAWPQRYNEIVGGQTTPTAANAITTNPSNNTFFQNISGSAQLYSASVKFDPTGVAAATFEVAVNGSAASTTGAIFPLGRLSGGPFCPTVPAAGPTGQIMAFSWVIPSGAYCQLAAVNATRQWATSQSIAAGR